MENQTTDKTTNMTNPPGDNTTKNVAPKATKMVKIKAMRDFNLTTIERPIAPSARAGQELEVSEEDAVVLTKKIEGMYNFGGDVSSDNATRHQIVKAVRL